MVFAVTDSGPGVSTGILDALAGRDEAARRPSPHSGVGLGLSIAAQSAELLGGILKACPQKAGSRFEFRLPLSVCLPRQDRTLSTLSVSSRLICAGMIINDVDEFA